MNQVYHSCFSAAVVLLKGAICRQQPARIVDHKFVRMTGLCGCDVKHITAIVPQLNLGKVFEVGHSVADLASGFPQNFIFKPAPFLLRRTVRRRIPLLNLK